jgi:predicted metalloprotease with PDZ domain
MRLFSFVALLLMAMAAEASGQETVRYLVRVDDPASKLYHVEAELAARGDTTYVSLPAWTPGHYKLENYARYVRHFEATDGARPLRWDKLDKDTWRIVSAGASTVQVSFDFPADTVELSMSLLRDDFGFFNGTNLFVYPEGAAGYEFPAEVRLELPDGWKVATELQETDDPFVFRASDYHELVDNPTFIGHFAIDSVEVDGSWSRLAVYPAPYMRNPAREMALEALGVIAATIHGMFPGRPPYDRYTTLIYLDNDGFLFLAGLEHADSHLDLMPAAIFEQPRFTFRQYLFSLLAHEYYHAWNVKRIRPLGLWPYAYDREQETALLWVSEGITDYYGNLILVRSGLWSVDLFWAMVREAIQRVEEQPVHEAVEDASINTWIEPTFVDPYLYYDQGGLLGLLLDIRIRQATDNQQSLDDVMARLYSERYLEGRGFTTDDVLGYIGEYIGEQAAGKFYERYVDGREPLPYKETLALAGMRYDQDTIIEPFFGVQIGPDRERRLIVRQVVPGSAAAVAGLQVGDELLAVGSVDVVDDEWGDDFVEAYASSIGGPLAVLYRRDGEEVVAETRVQTRTRYNYSLRPFAEPSEAQQAIKRGIEKG